MDKEELLRKIMELPKEESKNSVSSFSGINVEDLMITINRFDKIPTYDELLRENKKQKEIVTKIKMELIENEILDDLPFDVSERICALFDEVTE